MTTRINVTVDDGGLLDRNAQQQAANRQGFVLRSAQEEAAIQAEGDLQRRRTAERRDAATGQALPATGSRIRRIDQEPAAFRYGAFDVGAIYYKVETLRYVSENDSEDGFEYFDRTVKIKVGHMDASSSYEFTYNYDKVKPLKGDKGFAEPLNVDIAGTVYNTLGIIWPDENLSLSLPYNPVLSASSESSEAGSVVVDKTHEFIVPDGTGGAYLYVHVNDYFRSYVYDVSASRTATHDEFIYEQGLGWYKPVPEAIYWQRVRFFEGVAEGYDNDWIERSANLDTPPLYGFTLWPPRFFVSKSTIRSTAAISGYRDNELSRNVVYIFHVTANGVTEITANSSVLSRINLYSKPALANVQTVVDHSQFNHNYSWSGATTGGELTGITETPIRPIGIDVEELADSEATISVPSYDESLDPPGFGDYIDMRLLRHAGGLDLNTPQFGPVDAWGPSFALSLRNVQELTEDQSEDLDYILTNVLDGAKIKKSVTPADGDKIRVPSWYDDNYTVGAYTNWGDYSICRKALSYLL
ncbi:MAG: hypothetical protein ACO24H_05200 [Polynucleobacter sp.]